MEPRDAGGARTCPKTQSRRRMPKFFRDMEPIQRLCRTNCLGGMNHVRSMHLAYDKMLVRSMYLAYDKMRGMRHGHSKRKKYVPNQTRIALPDGEGQTLPGRETDTGEHHWGESFQAHEAWRHVWLVHTRQTNRTLFSLLWPLRVP
jgi:hypothetical protein